jgi:ABC-type branched-subunit amino acid transport system substrate-binding protein
MSFLHLQFRRSGVRVLLAAIASSALLAACSSGVPGAASNSSTGAFRIGFTGALTGPNAAVYAAVYESISIYLQRLNDQGGINGRRVDLLVEDDAGDATRATANATRLVNQENVPLLILASPSASYGPVMAITKAAATPVLIVGACPKETLPPAEPLVYCSASYGTTYDSAAAIRFIRSIATEEVRLGLVGVDVPVSRAYMDSGAAYGLAAGMKLATTQVMPLTVTDFTPFATQVAQSGTNWAWAGGPWGAEIGPFDALQKLGWRGNYMLWAHQPAEEEFRRRHSPNLYGLAANTLFAENLPIHNEIRIAAAKYGATYPAEQLAEGWVTAMALEETLRTTEAPGLGTQVQAALNTLDLDTRGLRGTRLTFTPENHFRTRTSYRVYHWDERQERIVALRDWETVDILPR